MAQNNALYKSERSRLETFVEYPHSNVDVRNFASAGFYYTGNADEVCCTFCEIKLHRWQPGDNPMEDHKRWSKYCKFVNGVDVGNIPMDPDDESVVITPNQSKGVDECGLYGVTPCYPTEDISLEVLGVCRRYNPTYPMYATLESRLQTYKCWPVGIKLSPQDLSEAGFYYTGIGDRTLCFQCGGGLKDWSENDDPWIEHAQYFFKCTYLLQKKGRDFVTQVLAGMKTQESAGERKPVMDTSSAQDDTTLVGQDDTTLVDQDDTTLVECSSSDVGSDSSGYNSGGSFQEESHVSSTEVKKLDDQRACKICYQEEMGIVFLPCGHIVACVNCVASLKTCAICRKPFSATVRAYLS